MWPPLQRLFILYVILSFICPLLVFIQWDQHSQNPVSVFLLVLGAPPPLLGAPPPSLGAPLLWQVLLHLNRHFSIPISASQHKLTLFHFIPCVTNTISVLLISTQHWISGNPSSLVIAPLVHRNILYCIWNLHFDSPLASISLHLC